MKIYAVRLVLFAIVRNKNCQCSDNIVVPLTRKFLNGALFKATALSRRKYDGVFISVVSLRILSTTRLEPAATAY